MNLSLSVLGINALSLMDLKSYDMKKEYILDAVRTPIGRYGGALSLVRPDDLAAIVIKALMDRNPSIAGDMVEDVILGCANQAGEDNRNIARMALLLAGLPNEVGGLTVNRLCASGLQAIMDAGRAIMCGDGDVYIAGGVESMSRAPFVMAKSAKAFNRIPEVYDTTMGWRFVNPALSKMHHPYGMGETAENVVEKWNIKRDEQDDFAYQSQQKYAKAHSDDRFKDEIIPVSIPQRKGEPVVITKDEHPRPETPREKLSQLKPAFKKEGTVTAGNSSGINDGASVVLVVSEDVVKKYNLKPLAMIRSMAIAGVDPAIMGIGPVPATKKALKRAGLNIDDIDIAELNEAFASQSLACIKELDISPQKVNLNGGAIALGHPLGCSGARIATSLLHEMNKTTGSRYGLATMCVGVGQGAAMIFEKE